MLYVILIIAIIVLLVKYNKLKDEYLNYRKKQEKFLKKLENAGVIKKKGAVHNKDIQETRNIENIESVDTNEVSISIQNTESKEVEFNNYMEEKIQKQRENRQNNDNKLNWLFGIGFSLLCLTYFVLISSTWDILSNGLKCILVPMFSLIFFGASIVLEKITKKSKASMVFWTLGLIYVPFSLITLFGLELLGSYLSFSGPGSNLCLLIIAVVTLILSLISMIKFKNEAFGWIYIIAEFLTILFGVRIFTVNYYFNLLIMTIYTSIIVFALDFLNREDDAGIINQKFFGMYNTYSSYRDFLIVVLNILVFATGLLSICILNSTIVLGITILILAILNMYISISKKIDTYGFFGLGIFLMAILSFVSLVIENNIFDKYVLISSIYTFILVVLRNAIGNSEEESVFSYIVRIFSYFIIPTLSILLIFVNAGIMSIVSFIATILSIIIIVNKEEKINFLQYIMPILSIIFTCKIIDLINPNTITETCNFIVFLVLTGLFMIVSIFDDIKIINKFKQPFQLMVPIITCMLFIFEVAEGRFEYQLIYGISATLMYIITYLTSNNEEHNNIYRWGINILSYTVVFITATEFLDTNVALALIGTIYFIANIATKNILNKFYNSFNIITIIAIISGLLVNVFEFERYMIWYYIISTLAFAYYSRVSENESLKDFFKVSTMLTLNLVTASIMSYLTEITNVLVFEDISVFITTLGISLVLLYNKKMKKIHLIYLGIFNVLSAMQISAITRPGLICDLLPSLSYIGLTLTQLPYMEQKTKDMYKAVIYLVLLIPYKIVLGHFDLSIVVLDAIIYLTILFLITRTILKKYMTDVNTLEICMLIIIYLISLISGLESFQQSIALNLLLVIMILFSFFKQENNIFKCSSISFLVMVFVQTKALDFPIGWLICLLLFGLFFVTFATLDEIKKRR